MYSLKACNCDLIQIDLKAIAKYASETFKCLFINFRVIENIVFINSCWILGRTHMRGNPGGSLVNHNGRRGVKSLSVTLSSRGCGWNIPVNGQRRTSADSTGISYAACNYLIRCQVERLPPHYNVIGRMRSPEPLFYLHPQFCLMSGTSWKESPPWIFSVLWIKTDMILQTYTVCNILWTSLTNAYKESKNILSVKNNDSS